MGLRGPAPTPTEIKLVRGNPGKRALNKREPKPKPVAPFMPVHLDAEAIVEWKRLLPILSGMRVLAESDYMALACLCQAFSTLAKAQAQLNEDGLLVETALGGVKASPLIAIVSQNREQVTKLSREFGLTPSARSRVVADVPRGTADDPWAKFG